MELGPLRRVAPTDQSDPDHRPHRLIPESAKPERRVRPDGSRARFLAASAAGNTTIGRDRGTGPELAAAAALKIILTANGCSVVPQPREPAQPDRRRALAANRTKTGPALTPARSAPGTRAAGHAANGPPWTSPQSSGPAVGGGAHQWDQLSKSGPVATLSGSARRCARRIPRGSFGSLRPVDPLSPRGFPAPGIREFGSGAAIVPFRGVTGTSGWTAGNAHEWGGSR